jgi:hypothetical protein
MATGRVNQIDRARATGRAKPGDRAAPTLDLTTGGQTVPKMAQVGAIPTRA